MFFTLSDQTGFGEEVSTTPPLETMPEDHFVVAAAATPVTPSVDYKRPANPPDVSQFVDM